MPRWGLSAATLAAATLIVVALLVGINRASPCRGDLPPYPGDSPPHHDPELESRFPDDIGGIPFELVSICANTGATGNFQVGPEFLAAVEADIDDVTLALSPLSLNEDPDLRVSVDAYRYHGASEDDIRRAFVDAMEDGGETMVAKQLGGKQVEVSEGPIVAGALAYIADDTIYFVSGSEGRCAELLAALP